MTSPLHGMEYKIVKKYPGNRMIIQPVSKFDPDGFAKLVNVVEGELVGRPVTLNLEEGKTGLQKAIKELEELNGIHE